MWPLLVLFVPNFVLPENHGCAQGVRGGESVPLQCGIKALAGLWFV